MARKSLYFRLFEITENVFNNAITMTLLIISLFYIASLVVTFFLAA
jgi:hypothetical protein